MSVPGFTKLGAPGSDNIISQILMWPSELMYAPKPLCIAATLGVPYLLYGLPSLADGIMPLAMWYGVAGVSYAAAERLTAKY